MQQLSPVVVEEVATNPHSRVFNVRRPLVDGDMVRLGRDKCNHGESAIGDLILAIPGVFLIYVNTYYVSLHKAVTYSWDEITPAVVELLSPFMER